MRMLCLLLILTNALYFIWAQLIDIDVSTMDFTVSPNPALPRIVLAKEAAAVAPAGDQPSSGGATILDSRVAIIPQRGKEPGRTDPAICTTVGPFADLPDAAQAQAALSAVGFQPRQRLEKGELWVGYWVSVQNLGTQKNAEDAVKKLGKAGITDVYVMPGSDVPNVLSLGVFSDPQRAQRRADQIRALGFEPRITDRKRAGSVYWVDIELPVGRSIDTSIFQTGSGRITRLEMRGCPQSTSAG